ncbi:MAG TPA: LON peptidase substrate-binding domain-containing protein [Trebonia sp.]|jgi:hypothetical protein|nr:LON peptidase substrate-binding domain-containing protein [Trebonia sp.]
MSEILPLFPLGTVLFPGMVLPLHVFEERYRELVRDLLAGPEPRELGIVAIRSGQEAGARSPRELHEVGCVAAVREVAAHDDGRFDLVTVGTRRFRLLGTDDARPYLQAQVEPLIDDASAEAGEDAASTAAMATLVAAVQSAFRSYLNALADRAGAVIRVADIPDDPALLSFVIAAAMIIDLPERQGLLAAPDAMTRLRAERQLLTRERAMLRVTTSRPAPDLRGERFSPN